MKELATAKGDYINIKNYFFPTESTQGNVPVKGSVSKDLRYAQIAPIVFSRAKQTIQSWRDAIYEAEQGMVQFKQRVQMQRIYLDVVLNGHVEACIKRYKRLVTKKGYDFLNPDGSVNEVVNKLLTKDWFFKIIDADLDSDFFGYSLVNFSDVVNNELFSRDPFGNLAPIKTMPRPWVSPDRMNVVNIPYNVVGIPFRDTSFRDNSGNCPYDWTFWFSTPSEIGISECGYGLLYKIALYEIYLRHLVGQEATFYELFGSPARWGKTNKTGDERDTFFSDLFNMGNSATIVTDPQDEISLIDTRNTGTGYQGFESFQNRLEKAITKIVFGHEDAMSSTPGKLGLNEEANKAVKETESNSCRIREHNVNTEVLPKLRKLGLPIPMGITFKIRNVEEAEEFRAREDASNKVTAEIAQTLKNAGLKMDAEYFTERTGIPVEAIEEQPEPEVPGEILKKIKNIYAES